MILCEPLSKTQKGVDEAAVVADQLAGHGLAVGLRRALIEVEGVHRNQRFDALKYAVDDLSDVDTLLLLSSSPLLDGDLPSLRKLTITTETRVIAVLPIGNDQARLNAEAKLSYVIGREVEVHAFDEMMPVSGTSVTINGAEGNHVSPRPTSKALRERIRILLAFPDVSGRSGEYIRFLAGIRDLQVSVLTKGTEKQDWQARYGTEVPFWHPGEILPRSLANRIDVMALFDETALGLRGNCLIADLRARNIPIIDATGHDADLLGQARLQGPSDIQSLISWLQSHMLPKFEAVSNELRAASGRIKDPLLGVLAKNGATVGRGPSGQSDGKTYGHTGTDAHSGARQMTPSIERKGIAFMPTNGVGLGHAQRCSLIASEMSAEGMAEKMTFLAFPSCLKMLELYGNDTVPLISRSKRHVEPYANDLVNATRISTVAKASRALVFDGGYVFDSIFRTAVDDGVPTAWVRRGMWQAGQNNSVALDREKAFTRTIVPLELFEELNQSYSKGRHLHQVNPIVRAQSLTETEIGSIRNRLSEKYGAFTKLVVTMLGGGVAADRSAHMAALCANMENMEDVLHLVVCWPTAVVPPATFGWKRSRVVQTHFATTLTQACDLFISAAGYNSFHESMYNKVPTIFVPQMNSFMDDQTARARAAADRDLALLADPEKILSLIALVRVMLNEGGAKTMRENLGRLTLPEPGQKAAARIIAEMAY